MNTVDNFQLVQEEQYEKALDKKITVIGDSWMRLLILPKGACRKRKNSYKGVLLEAAASRTVQMIRAATTDRVISIDHLYIPQNPKNQFEATGLLKEYEVDEEAAKKLKELAFPEEKIRDPFRMERHLGAAMLDGWDNSFVYKNIVDDHHDEDSSGDKYWVIYDDHLFNNEDIHNQDRKDLCAQLKAKASEPDWILWNSRSFGSEKDDNISDFQKLILDDDNFKKKTIVFLRADLLTEQGIGRREDRSVEECLEGIMNAFEKHSAMKKLKGCKAVVISGGIDFSFLIQWVNSEIQCTVIFRPIRTCRFYRGDMGFMRGFGVVVLVSCLKELIKTENQRTPEMTELEINESFFRALSDGIKDGLWRMLVQFHVGYPISFEKNNDKNIYFKHYWDIYALQSPEAFEKEYASCNGEERKRLEQKRKSFMPVWVRDVKLDITRNDDKSKSSYWSIIRRKPSAEKTNSGVPWLLEQYWKGRQDKYDFLKSIVEEGLKNLSTNGEIKFPIAYFGKMVVVDKEEIGMFRNLQALMRKYIASDEKKPLGLAVFGAPGAGKSFGIKEVAKGVWGFTKTEHLKMIECNLAQFTSSDDLSKKLLEAQNLSLTGYQPIVFLDEFDSIFKSEKYGWFKHLLSLLQDGTFRYDGSLYNLGKSFIVCAGGLSRSFKEFEFRSNSGKCKAAKMPDFISRLRGHVNIKGPNLLPTFRPPTESPDEPGESLVEDDPLYKIRRAVLLRSLLKEKMTSILSEDNHLRIDQGVLRALLEITEYKYGTRSIEAVIDMSVSAYRHSRRFTKAMIPQPEQLEIHVDSDEFFELMEAE